MESQKEHVQNHQPDYNIVHPMQKKTTTIFGGFQSHLMVNHWGWSMAGLPHASMEKKKLPTIGALQLCLLINHINYG